jgi:hypothetical protein
LPVAAGAGTLVRYVISFYRQSADTNPYAMAEIFVPLHANPGMTTIHRTRTQVLVPVIHEAPLLLGAYHFYVAVSDRYGLVGGAGSESISLSHVGGKLVRVDS